MIEDYMNEFYRLMKYHPNINLEEDIISCCGCPFSLWFNDFKRCMLLHKSLHPYFRIDAKLRQCPMGNTAQQRQKMNMKKE